MAVIEDVPYMQESCEEETYLFFVDSSVRDRTTFKTPSEYQVNFSSPFKNVNGFGVLNTSIPRTEYFVDDGRNTITYNIDGEGWETVTIDPGDYTIEQLQSVLTSGLVANGKSITVGGLTDPIDIKGKLKFKSDYPFKLNMSQSTIRNVVGFQNPIIQSQAAGNYAYPTQANQLNITSDATGTGTISITLNNITSNIFIHTNDTSAQIVNQIGTSSFVGFTAQATSNNLSVIFTANTPGSTPGTFSFNSNGLVTGNLTQLVHGYTEGDDDVFISVYDTSNVVLSETFLGPDPIVNEIAIGLGIRQEFIASITGNVANVGAYFDSSESNYASNCYFSIIDSNNYQYANGFIAVNITPYNIPSTSYQITNITNLSFGNTYYIEFTDPSNTLSMYYNDQNYPTVMSNVGNTFTYLAQTSYGSSWTPWSDLAAELCCQVVLGGYENHVVAPGCYDLTGPPYIILRCPEIEGQLYRSRAFEKYNMGLARIQLGVFGFAQDNNYTFNVPMRKFFPISKLSRLTFRFEKSDGSLYDFKGVDHNMILQLTYYMPKVHYINPRILNPTYDPDIQRWQVDQWEQENDKYNENDTRIPNPTFVPEIQRWQVNDTI